LTSEVYNMKKQIQPEDTTKLSDSHSDRILRWPEVHKRTGLCRSHVHDLAKKGSFPKPIKLGGRASGWLESEVNACVILPFLTNFLSRRLSSLQ